MKLVTDIAFIFLAVIYSAGLCTGDDPKTIEQFVEIVRKLNRDGLVKEHKEISKHEPKYDLVKTPSALVKNRQKLIFCLEHSRVNLSTENNDPTSNYIHANFVDGYKQTKAYIATQGPLPETINDFWRMVWEQDCLVIVMLTQVEEEKRPKCAQYWHTEVTGSVLHGNYRIKTTHAVDSTDDYKIISLELTNLKTKETRKITHCQFTSWPDHYIPEHTMPLLNFLEIVREQQSEMVKALHGKWSGDSQGPPIVVHCSAGVGRAGSFMTLDTIIKRLIDVGTVDIKTTVLKIRSQRADSVFDCELYIFCHLALIDYAVKHGILKSADLAGFEHPYWIDQFAEMVRERRRSGLVKEYSQIKSRQYVEKFVDEPSYLAKNRYGLLCLEHSRVHLSTENNDPTSNYIHANFVDGHQQTKVYIATQGPLPETCGDFWRMVWEQHCLVIAMLTKVKEDKTGSDGITKKDFVQCDQYWDLKTNGIKPCGNYRIKTTNVAKKVDYIITSLELTNSKTKEMRKVSHFQFTSWPDHGVPKNTVAILNFVEDVRKQQREMVKALHDKWTGDPRGPPIVAHCSAGAGRAGTFIALEKSIMSLEASALVDMKATIEKIRLQRAEAIQTPDQYVFCHLALIDYAVSHELLESVDLTGFDDHNDEHLTH